MDKDEFVEKVIKNQANVIHVEFDDDEVDIVYDVTDLDTGETLGSTLSRPNSPNIEANQRK